MMTNVSGERPVSTRFLMRYLWLSLATAVLTVGIKVAAAWLTQSAALLSDALESGVNLVAAAVAFWALRLSAKPADANHEFGHGKAEYFSSGIEGALIFVAAGGIIAGAILKLLNPVPLESLGLGMALSVAASVLNLGTGLILVRAGKKHRSIVLEADGRHLLTDVVTSIGVLVGIGLVLLTGAEWLDPVIAIVVGLNIVWTGSKLIRRSADGLLDATLPEEEVAIVEAVLTGLVDSQDCRLTRLRTRESGRQRFIQAIIEVPGEWTVERGHRLTEILEDRIEAALPGTEAIIHVEPIPATASEA